MTNIFIFITALHLSALGQLETGDDDRAIGRVGEVSRYQLRPAVWAQRTAAMGVHGSPRDPQLAKRVTLAEWSHRAATFAQRTGRAPSDRELYLLWNCPAHVSRPSRVELERAQRFANLAEPACGDGER